MSANASPVTDKALTLLGQGHPPVVVASALGVTESRISQLLADSTFAEKVTELRYKQLQKSTAIDDEYNELESKLLEKLRKSLPLISRPRDILAAVTVVNNAKRRGQQAPESSTVTQKTVNLFLPGSVQQRFVSNSHNQVTEIRDESTGSAQTLVTASSASLDGFVERKASEKLITRDTEVTAPEGSGESVSTEGETSLADYL